LSPPFSVLCFSLPIPSVWNVYAVFPSAYRVRPKHIYIPFIARIGAGMRQQERWHRVKSGGGKRGKKPGIAAKEGMQNKKSKNPAKNICVTGRTRTGWEGIQFIDNFRAVDSVPRSKFEGRIRGTGLSDNLRHFDGKLRFYAVSRIGTSKSCRYLEAKSFEVPECGLFVQSVIRSVGCLVYFCI